MSGAQLAPPSWEVIALADHSRVDRPWNASVTDPQSGRDLGKDAPSLFPPLMITARPAAETRGNEMIGSAGVDGNRSEERAPIGRGPRVPCPGVVARQRGRRVPPSH